MYRFGLISCSGQLEYLHNIISEDFQYASNRTEMT